MRVKWGKRRRGEGRGKPQTKGEEAQGQEVRPKLRSREASERREEAGEKGECWVGSGSEVTSDSGQCLSMGNYHLQLLLISTLYTQVPLLGWGSHKSPWEKTYWIKQRTSSWIWILGKQWTSFQCTYVPNIARGTLHKKLFVVYLKVKFNWVSCIFTC